MPSFEKPWFPVGTLPVGTLPVGFVPLQRANAIPPSYAGGGTGASGDAFVRQIFGAPPYK